MGKPTGFLEYDRKPSPAQSPEERIAHYGEFHAPLDLEERRQQGARCMDCGVPFCQSGMVLGGMASGCPLHNLVPEWNDLLFVGNWEEALRRLLKTNCFPEFTARVCPAPCEAACACGLNGMPVTIRDNERAIVEEGFARGLIAPRPPKVRTGKRVAVVGSGPAGLAAANQLNQRGHSVTVFEREDRPGGLLMYGIPNMKLEKQVVERRIRLMEEEGVSFVTGADVGNGMAPEELLERFDRVLLACGSSQPRDIDVPGREAQGICFAVDFLKSTTKALLGGGLEAGGFLSAGGKNVLVIGGGDTGNDCVGTALRHGARSVMQLEMMPKPPESRTPQNPWPQWPRVLKTDYGQEEAIALFGSDPRVYETTVKEFLADESGRVRGAVLVSLEAKSDGNGRRSMVPVPGSEREVPAELVLIAAGFVGAQRYVAEAFGLPLNERGAVATADYRTENPKLFAAGDMRRGQSLVVWAIREGREAARAIDESLMGYSLL